MVLTLARVRRPRDERIGTILPWLILVPAFVKCTFLEVFIQVGFARHPFPTGGPAILGDGDITPQIVARPAVRGRS